MLLIVKDGRVVWKQLVEVDAWKVLYSIFVKESYFEFLPCRVFWYCKDLSRCV
jgi:hypothetical protein